MARKTKQAEQAQDIAPENATVTAEGGDTPLFKGGLEDEAIKLVYIGPSIPFGKLRTSMILEGTREEIEEYLADVVDKYPEAARLMTTPENLTRAMDKVATKGNILHKYAQDMAAKIRANRK